MLRNSYNTCPQHSPNTNQPTIKMVKGILVNRKSDETLKSQLKMEHADLVAEMQTVENLPTHERLQLARLRRAQQLKVARQKEKEWLKLQRAKGNQIPGLLNGTSAGTTHHFRNSKTSNTSQGSGGGLRHISFENSVVLLEAASRNDMQEVAELLEHGITPDAANEDGLTALHQCCIDNNVEMLRLLLEYGANVDAQDSDKWTPLHAAATCGHLELVRILIEHGANLLAVNTDGNMPYDLCDDENTLDFIEAEMSKRGVTQELIDDTRSATERQMLKDLMEVARCGGDLEEPDNQGATPLHIAAANGYVRVVEFLLEMHVNVDAVDKDMWSPVHAAACWGHLEVLEMLAQCGADLNIKNKDDETPSDISDDPEIRERIEQLKTEQESKRLAEAQRRRVRRSQSSNTRAQSVRRTSLRDKTLTTKKDAVEEARLRLQAQEVFIAPDGTATTSNPQTDPNAVPGSGDALLVDAATNTSTRLSNNNNNLNNNHNNNNLIKSGERKSSYTSQNGHNVPASVALQNGGYGLDAIDATLDTDLYAAAGAGGAAAATTTHTHSYLPRRPPDGRENDELLLSNYQLLPGVAASAASVILSEKAAAGAVNSDAVQIQSSKEAANGKINVQVTVLVGAATQTPASTTVAQAGAASSTTTTVQHHLYQQHQHQLAPQQQLNNNIGQSSATNSSQLAINNNNNNGLLSHNEQLLLNGGSGSIAALGANTMLNNSMIHVQQPLAGDFNALSNSSTLSGDNMSAFSSVNKFSGVTGDVVSDSTSSKKCCTIM